MGTANRKEAAAFLEDVKPYLDELHESAWHHLAYHQARGELDAKSLTAEEVVGETLILAFDGRKKRPTDVPLRSWLLSVESRAIDAFIAAEEGEHELWAFSLDEPLPCRSVHDEHTHEGFWTWVDLDELESVAESVAAPDEPLSPQTVAAMIAELKTLRPKQWRAWLLSDAHRLSLQHVASALGESVDRASEFIREARQLLSLESRNARHRSKGNSEGVRPED